MRTEQHKDGVWETSERYYKGRRILIKSRKGKGMKCHVFHREQDKVDFTLRYRFILPETLLKKAKDKIDRLNASIMEDL